MIVFIIIAIVIVSIAVFTLVTYNDLVKTNNIVKEAFSTMDVYLKKRWELIPNLVETVKGYSVHEKDTLEEIVSLRNSAYDSMDTDKKIDVNESIDMKMPKIMAIKEAYPELKSSDNFKKLSEDLVNIEDEIASSRKYYNGAVRMLNNKVLMFPSNIIAGIFGFKEAKMFEANEEEKESVKVNFNE